MITWVTLSSTFLPKRLLLGKRRKCLFFSLWIIGFLAKSSRMLRRSLSVAISRFGLSRTEWFQQLSSLSFSSIFYVVQRKYIVTRNNIVWKLARDYCLCYCKTFSLEPDSTECTEIFVTEMWSTLFVPPKIKQYYRSK